MNPKTVRVGLIGTGVITVLVLILYLPLWIWSPSWDSRGYYRGPQSSELDLIHRVNKHGVADGIVINGAMKWKKHSVLSDNLYANLFLDDVIMYKIEQDGLYRIRSSTSEPIVKAKKIYNPFTIWYIKWLEWSGE